MRNAVSVYFPVRCTMDVVCICLDDFSDNEIEVIERFVKKMNRIEEDIDLTGVAILEDDEDDENLLEE